LLVLKNNGHENNQAQSTHCGASMAHTGFDRFVAHAGKSFPPQCFPFR